MVASRRALLGLLLASGCSLEGYRFNGRTPDVLRADTLAEVSVSDGSDASMNADVSDASDATLDAVDGGSVLDASAEANGEASTDTSGETTAETSADTNGDAGTFDGMQALDGGSPDALNMDATGTDAPVLPTDAMLCDGGAFVPGALYVSLSGTATGPGTAEMPFNSLVPAIARARASGATVIYIDEGTYGGAVALDGFTTPLSVRGGVLRTASRWGVSCAPNPQQRVVLATGAPTAVSIVNSTARISLSTLTVRTRAARAGENLVGVYVVGVNSAVALQNVAVQAFAGGPGTPGAAGAPGVVSMCNRVTACSAFATPVRVGTAGMVGTDGANARNGTFSATDWVPGVAGAGTAGTAGTPGSAGGPGATRMDCFDCAGVAGGTGTNALRCEGGRTRTGDPGQCGCGGTGGGPGQPGSSGGASIALLVSGPGATVDVTTSDLLAGNGGAGGAGGLGGMGRAGEVGALGMARQCELDCIVPNANACFRAPPEVARAPVPVAGGSAGGTGGAGGNGGRGGHGAGGPSYGIVTVQGAMVFTDSMTTVRIGAGGAPGGTGGVTGPIAERVSM